VSVKSNSFLQLLSDIAWLFLSLFVDRFSFSRENTLLEILLLTWRFRLAGLGFFFHPNEKKILKLKNKHLGKRCFIIGNGPSLNSLDIKKLSSEITFGVNAIFLNYEKMGFYPTYYVVEDSWVLEDRYKEINQLKGPENKFFGCYAKKRISRDDNNIFLNIRRDVSRKNWAPRFSKNICREVCVGGSVTYVCMELAYYMGFSEVYLIGFDHNYIIPKSSEVQGVDILSNENDPNHFHPNYFGKGYHWHLPREDRMEIGYRKAKEIFELDGRNIFNATVGGKLEVFPRKNFEELFK
jgi:hypothetical protein